jgi:hypothetical protein
MKGNEIRPTGIWRVDLNFQWLKTSIGIEEWNKQENWKKNITKKLAQRLQANSLMREMHDYWAKTVNQMKEDGDSKTTYIQLAGHAGEEHTQSALLVEAPLL